MANLELNEFSRKIANALFKQFPDWCNYARVDENENRDEGGILYVEVPVPLGSNLNRPLYVLTANEEVVVGLIPITITLKILERTAAVIALFKRF